MRNHHFFTTTGRRIFFAALICFFAIQSSAQVMGRQNVDQFPVTAWGTPTYGLTWLPTDYASNPTQKYPLIIFLHGSGEGGDGVQGLNNLMIYGLPNKIANGFNPEAINPVDGKNYKFIVVSPQAPSAAHWSYAWGSIQWILQDVINRYRVDVSRIYVTGISAGGAGTWSCYTNGNTAAQKFAAIVPVSSAGTNSPAESDQIPMVGGTYGGKVWSIAGVSDAWYAFAQSSTNTINNANPAPAVPAITTGVPGGHDPGAWNLPYDANWRNNSQNLNIYEWMLKYTRGSSVPPPPPSNQIPTVNAGADQSITMPVNSVTLNGTASDADGSIVSYQWSQVTGPANATIVNTSSATTLISSMIEGTYTFRLTATDNGGASKTDDVQVYVNPAPSVPIPAPVPVPLPGQVEAENYVAMNGVQTENTADAGGGRNVGWQDNNDWLDYSLNVTVSGNYNVNFRVATPNSGTQFQLRRADGTVMTTVNVPNTGGWQNWQTVSTQLNLPLGIQTLRIFTNNAAGGWNINWFSFAQATTPPPPPPPAGTTIKIEAETYSAMSGIQKDNTSDIGGGQNVGSQDLNDWVDYSVNLATAGTYTLNFRIATMVAGAKFELRNSGGTALATVSVPSTGTYQTWQTISATATLPAGQQTLRIFTTASPAGWNFNWWEIAGAGTGTNQAPTVNAGADQTITLPTNSVTVTGTATDADGSIASYQWSQVSGPSTATIANTSTASTSITALVQGTYTFRLKATDNAGASTTDDIIITVNAASTPPPAGTTIRIEAENYASMYGVQKEATSDAGGGQNLGGQDLNDWADYSVNLASAGTYTMNFRIATMVAGAKFEVRNSGGTVLATVSVPSTGTYQTWQTISAQVTLPAGQQTIRIFTTASPAGWNLNWLEFVSGAASKTVSTQATTETATAAVTNLSVYPNPVTDRFMLQVNNDQTGAMKVQLVNMNGSVQKQFSLNKANKGATQTYLSIGDVPKGNYVIVVNVGEWSESVQLVKL